MLEWLHLRRFSSSPDVFSTISSHWPFLDRVIFGGLQTESQTAWGNVRVKFGSCLISDSRLFLLFLSRNHWTLGKNEENNGKIPVCN